MPNAIGHPAAARPGGVAPDAAVDGGDLPDTAGIDMA